jgi:hypothetical protein
MFEPTTCSDVTDDSTDFFSPEQHAVSLRDEDLQRADGFGRIVVSGSETSPSIVMHTNEPRR